MLKGERDGNPVIQSHLMLVPSLFFWPMRSQQILSFFTNIELVFSSLKYKEF
jgi:hypothetical protein